MFHRTVWTGELEASKVTLRSILRVSMPASILLYCAGFHYAYVNWISIVWGYEGLTYKSPNPALLALAYVLAAVQCSVSPLKLRRPSHAIYWILYFTVYIPGLFVPLFMQLDDGMALLLLQLSLTCGMLIIAISYRFSLLTFRRYPINPRLFWTVFAVTFLACNAVLIVAFRNNLHFASLEEIYSVRHQAGKVVEENPLIGYVSQLLGNVLNPLLIAHGLASRQKKLTVLGTLGELIVYSTGAAKASLLAPILAAGFYYTIKRERGGWAPKTGLFLAGLFFSLTTLVIEAKPGVLFNIATITLARTFAAPGMLIGRYQYFFENQPHTYLGTVTGINLLLPNPYTLPLGMEVASFYGSQPSSDRGMVDENADFFATDGIGGFGLPGILMAGVLCAAVFWALDSCARNYSMGFSVSALTMVIISLGNVSLFSTLLGNGLLAWMLLFVIMPRSFLGSDIRTHSLRNRA
jgi:hypothetical protein